MKVYDFELEQTMGWCIELENKIQSIVPRNINSKKREKLLDKAFHKIDNKNWNMTKLCERCGLKTLPKGHKKLCVDCIRLADSHTDEGLVYGI